MRKELYSSIKANNLNMTPLLSKHIQNSPSQTNSSQLFKSDFLSSQSNTHSSSKQLGVKSLLTSRYANIIQKQNFIVNDAISPSATLKDDNNNDNFPLPSPSISSKFSNTSKRKQFLGQKRIHSTLYNPVLSQTKSLSPTLISSQILSSTNSSSLSAGERLKKLRDLN
jgi:hypothetical protein